MKKILLVCLVLAGLSTVSCKKDYTCECVTVMTEDGTEIDRSTTTTNFNAKKSDAETSCDGLKQTSTNGDMSITTTCNLK